MHFVKDDERSAFECGVVLQTTSQDAFGENFNAGAGSDAAFIACLVAHCVTRLFSQHVRHALSCGACGESAWFQHDDAAPGNPWLINQS